MDSKIASCYPNVNSKLRIASSIANCYDSDMNVKQIRVLNLKRFIKEKADEKQAKFSELYGLNKGHVSQMVTGHRDMGDKVARKIESALGLPPGAMDTLPKVKDCSELPVDAHQVAVDWLLISEPLKSQISEAVHSAADVARKYGPLADQDYVADSIKPAPTPASAPRSRMKKRKQR